MKTIPQLLLALVAGVCLLFSTTSEAAEKPKPFSGMVESFEGGVLSVSNKKAGETKDFTISEEVEIAKSDKSEASSDDLVAKARVRVFADADGNVTKVIIAVPKPKEN